MKVTNGLGTALGVSVALSLGACVSTPPPQYSSPPPQYSPYSGGPASNSSYSGYGSVQSIELVQQNSNNNSSNIGLGTLAGAVVGGVVGNQVGAGRGNTVATVAGAAGGAYVGHQLEKGHQQTVDAYKITVRMDDGSYQAQTQNSSNGLRVGDRVRFENGIVQRY